MEGEPLLGVGQSFAKEDPCSAETSLAMIQATTPQQRLCTSGKLFLPGVGIGLVLCFLGPLTLAWATIWAAGALVLMCSHEPTRRRMRTYLSCQNKGGRVGGGLWCVGLVVQLWLVLRLLHMAEAVLHFGFAVPTSQLGHLANTTAGGCLPMGVDLNIALAPETFVDVNHRGYDLAAALYNTFTKRGCVSFLESGSAIGRF